MFLSNKLLKLCKMCTFTRTISTNYYLLKADNQNKLIIRDNFAAADQKDKQTYLELISIFEGRDKFRRGHVEFINTALKHMEDFDVHKDVEVYKALLNVLPKGKFIPQNILQAEFMHYPKQQQVAIDLLEQMENNGVMPDPEFENILVNIFGNRGYPCRKFWRMMYWMPKFKNLSPWPIPNPVPNEPLKLARLALSRISSVDLQSELKEYNSETVETSIDKTWIISVQSPKQRELIAKHPTTESVFIEGPFLVWLRNASVHYFILRAKPKPLPEIEEIDPDNINELYIPHYEKPRQIIPFPSVHEQDDGTILAMCATGTSSQDSLLSWIRLIEKDGNPALEKIPVVFSLRLLTKELTTAVDDTTNNNITLQNKNENVT